MEATGRGDPASGEKGLSVERTSDRELVVTRAIGAPVAAVFDAWTRPELFRQWWTPRSFGLNLLSCEIDARPGGTYRLVFAHPAAERPMAFFGRYLEVAPNARLVWTNEEGGEAGAVTTVTFEARGGQTLVVMRDAHPSAAALDEAIASGGTCGFGETFDQLDELLTRPASTPPSA